MDTNENGKEPEEIRDPEEIRKWIEDNPPTGVCEIWIDCLDGSKIDVSPIEIIELRKEVLYVLDQCGANLNEGYLLDTCFAQSYWHYTRVNGDKYFNEEERNFAIEGGLIVTIAMINQFILPDQENRNIFGETPLQEVENYVFEFKSDNKQQQELASIALSGIQLAMAMVDDEVSDVVIEDMKAVYYEDLPWVGKNFIEPYYKRRLEDLMKN